MFFDFLSLHASAKETPNKLRRELVAQNLLSTKNHRALPPDSPDMQVSCCTCCLSPACPSPWCTPPPDAKGAMGDAKPEAMELSWPRASAASAYEAAAEGDTTDVASAVGEKRLMGAAGDRTFCGASSCSETTGVCSHEPSNAPESSSPEAAGRAGDAVPYTLSSARHSPATPALEARMGWTSARGVAAPSSEGARDRSCTWSAAALQRLQRPHSPPSHPAFPLVSYLSESEERTFHRLLNQDTAWHRQRPAAPVAMGATRTQTTAGWKAACAAQLNLCLSQSRDAESRSSGRRCGEWLFLLGLRSRRRGIDCGT